MAVTVRIPFDTTSNKDLLKTGSLRKIFDNTMHEVKSEYPILFNDLKTSDEYERDVRMAGLEEAVEITEGQNIPVSAPVLDVTKTYTQREFGVGFRMTYKMDYFNKYSLWKRWSADCARLQKDAKDVEIATMVNDPTSTSLVAGVGFDTKAVADNSHTLLDAASSTYDNYLSAALSISGIQSARYYFAQLKNDMGRWMGAIPTVLYFEPTLYFTAQEIFGSELLAHELSNTVNVLPKMKLKLFEYHRLSGVTKWGMAAPQDPNYDFNVFTAMEPRFFSKDAPDNTLDKVAISLQYFTYGWGDPRLLYVGI
jgi:hypothetical protein